MKTFLLMICLWLPTGLFSQNYQAFYPDQLRFFSADFGGTYGNLFAMGIQSQNPSDSAVFYGYHVWGDPIASCFDSVPGSIASPYSTSWMGDSVRITDSTTVFYNQNGQPITFPKNLQQGQAWDLFIDSSGNRFEAFVAFIDSMEFGFLQDSVATIELQVFSPSGTQLISPLDTVRLLMSKHYGFVKSLAWGYFPGVFDAFHLSTQEVLTGETVYDLEIGDIFQTRTNRGQSSTDAEYRVFSKSFSSNNDSLFYGIEKVSFTYTSDPNSPIITIDTISQSFSLTALSFPIDSVLPDQTFSLLNGNGDTEIRRFSEEYGGLGVLRPDSFYPWQTADVPGSDSCFVATVSEVFAVRNVYVEGIGALYYELGPMGSIIEEKLVYYNKSTGVWGDPVLNIERDLVSHQVHIGPNPVEGELNVLVDLFRPAEIELQVVDLQGKKLRFYDDGFQQAGKHQLRLDLETLPGGFYFLQIRLGEEELTRKIQKL